jgi:spermidine/putrescine-binding protein
MKVLSWPGMPAEQPLADAARRIGVSLHVETASSNERLEARMREQAFDVVFPSDYLVERLTRRGELVELAVPADVLDRIAEWAREAPHDPGCRWSLPFAFGTTGFVYDVRRWPGGGSWIDLFRPAEGVRVGMLDEVRELVGAALIALGHSPNDTSEAALGSARDLLLAQRSHVAAYDSDDFIGPVVRGEVIAHQAWSGPAAAARREHGRLEYVVPDEGAGLWITTGAIPADAGDPDAARALLLKLADPATAARTTIECGFATPNEPARELLPAPLRGDTALFPEAEVLARCHTFRDLGEDDALLQRIFEQVVG